MTAPTPSLKELFLAALEVAPDERAAWLHRKCAADAGLCEQVNLMLAAHDTPQSLFDRPEQAGPIAALLDRANLGPTIGPSAAESIGTAIGPYKLLEQIGEGGMGVVYVADQTSPVRRRVLKIIKPGMDTKQVIARFEAERQALAMMDHPHIARVLDAGTTNAGRPYFAMDLVRGMPITEYCDQERLSPRQRLALFIDVCQAVQHAHQKGIIHRDLKPSNVMITLHDGVPIVKVIDFGVAKAIGQQLTERTVYTALTQLVGTPLYMSPEQAELSGLDIDTRSDVYSLGVLLYELLTSTTPFDKERLKNAGFDEMRRMIREVEPPRPSTRVSTLGAEALSTISQRRSTDPRRITATLRGELDWIVMKALEKDRSRRYESASALAADIHRYLSDEPVLACPPTTMYRFQKFARKHKPALATAAAIALCLILGTTVSAWQAVRATTAEALATVNEAQAQASAQEAKTKAQEATTQRDEAQRQRDEVKALNDKLAAKEQQLQQSLYASNMILAQHAWDAGGISRTNELLEQHRPKQGETDLRGFEWHYLYRLCHSDLLTLKGHTTSMTPHSVAFSPDGKRLASASNDNTVKVRDAQTGQELLSLKGGGKCVAFSPDGKRLAAGGGTWKDDKNVAGQVRVWDAQTGQELLHIKAFTSSVHCVSFSPDGKRLASGSGEWTSGAETDGVLKVWDAQTGQELLSLKPPTSAVYSVAFSPDGKRLASASGGDNTDGDNSVKMWDAQTGNELQKLKRSIGWVYCVAFSSDGKRLASASERGLKVWDAQSGQELLSEMVDSAAISVAFSPDGKRLALAAKEVKVRDAQTGDKLLTFKGHTKWVTSIVFSPDGTRLASGSLDGTVKVWDATTSQEPRTVSGHNSRARSVSFSPDGKRVAFAASGTVKVADALTGQELISLKGHTGELWCVAFSPDGKRLASASSDKTVKVWDAQTGRELLTFKGHTSAVASVAFSPDSTRLASCSSNPNEGGFGFPGEPGEVKVWDAQTGRELLNLVGHTRFVDSVVFSPDGKRLATLSRDNTVKVWDAQSGHEIFTLKTIAYLGGSVTFSPDGKRLASSNSNPWVLSLPAASGIKVWDAQTGEELFTVSGHSAQVHGVGFSPDGKRLVTAAGGHGPASLGELKVWDARTGQELLTLDGRCGPSNDVAFSPDGHHLAGVGRGGALKIWDATPLPEKP